MNSKNMDRRTFLKTVGAGASLALTGPLFSTPAKKKRAKPNIVMIYLDDLDFDELNVYNPIEFPTYTGAKELGIYKRWGPEKYYRDKRMLTPHIDSLARDGAVFTRFYVTTSVCTPSRYSLLTGRYASRSPGFCEKFPPGTPANIQWNTPLDPSETNIAKILKTNGYTTGMVGKWHNGGIYGRARGLSKDADPYDPGVTAKIKKHYHRGIRYLNENLGFDFVERVYFGNKEQLGLPKAMQVHNLEWITEGALTFIDKYHHKPFFLYMALTTPHGQFSSGFLKTDPLFTPSGLPDSAPKGHPTRASIRERLWKAGIPKRHAMATWIDDSVGAVLEKLKERGLSDNTVVVFSSDHQSRGKYTCYEGCRVPFIVRWPGKIEPGSQIDALCANIDLAPTFVRMAGGTPPVDMTRDGRSFLPLLLGNQKQTVHRDSLLLECSNIRAVVTDKWKYIANRPPAEIRRKMEKEARECAASRKKRRIGWDGRKNSGRGIRFGSDLDFPNYFDYDQLYDLENDVYEQENLAANPKYAKNLAQLKNLLKEHLGSLPHTFGEFKGLKAVD